VVSVANRDVISRHCFFFFFQSAQHRPNACNVAVDGFIAFNRSGYFAAYKRQATQGLFGKTEQWQGNERDKSATDCEIKTTDEIWRQSQAAAAFGRKVTHCN